MTGKPAATGCHHPSYPEYADRYGEDPARFIYHLPVRPRIRGIEDPMLLSAYLHVLDDYRDSNADLDLGDHTEDVDALIDDIQARMRNLQADDSPDATAAAVATDGGEQR